MRKYVFFISASFIIITSPLLAQNFSGAKSAFPPGVKYQFPKNGDINIQPGTTLILRPAKWLLQGHSISDLSFTVLGERSGNHEGKAVISDDHETVIFIPRDVFMPGEKVHVTFLDTGSDMRTPLSYSFCITSLSSDIQAYWLNYFNEKFEMENAQFRKAASTSEKDQGLPLDTLPWYFPKMTIDLSTSGAAPGNIFLTPVGSSITTEFAFITFVNNAGAPLFEREIKGPGSGTADFKVLPNNNLIFPIAVRGNGGSIGVGVFYEMNSHFDIIDSFKCGNGIAADIHDFELLPNGHALLMAYNPVPVGPSMVADNIIQEIDNDKHVVFEWKALDHYHVGDATHEDTTAISIDFAHLNSMQTDTDGNIIASFRNLDEVAKIDRQTGDIIWHWGGKHNQFTFAGDTLMFSHQHDVRRIANGHITMFDNGNFHSVLFQDNPIVAPSSRAVEYDLDISKHKATTVWQYRSIPFSSAAGNMQRLGNGNTFIGLGNFSSPSALEVTPDKNVVFQLSLPERTVSYRAYRFNWSGSESTRYSEPKHPTDILRIYPNPAESSSTVSFVCTDAGIARVELIDMLGHELRSLSQPIPEKGAYSFNINVQDIPCGIYYCKFSQNSHSFIKTLVVQR